MKKNAAEIAGIKLIEHYHRWANGEINGQEFNRLARETARRYFAENNKSLDTTNGK
jgi:hypothetical protein